jgi:hypothetical protein
MGTLLWLLTWIGIPVVGGLVCSRIAKSSKGKNGRAAFTSASWGFWLLLLMHLPFSIIPVPVIGGLLSWVLYLIPSAICFLVAVNYMLKEMKAQRVGEYTDAA